MILRPSPSLLLATALVAGGAAESPAQSRIPTVDTLTVASTVLGEERRVFVALPDSWEATTRPYPVLVVFDGEFLFSPVATVVRTLADLGHMPETIVVGVANLDGGGMRSRVRDLTPPGLVVSGSSRPEGGDRFLDFLETEVLTEIDARYRGGHPRMLVGHSSGGVLATWAAATRPDRFPVVVSVDAPIHLEDGWLGARLTEAAAARPAPVLRYASLEARFGWSDERWARLAEAAPADWTLLRRGLPGESHQTAPFLATYEGLKGLFADYSVAGAPSDETALELFERYRRLDDTFETPLPPPRSVLTRLAEDLLMLGEWDAAVRARHWMADAYGDLAEGNRLDALFAQVEPLLPLDETLQDLRDTPWPTPDEMEPYLGVWAGEYRSGSASANAMELRLRVVDGVVAGDLVQWPGDGAELVQPLEYLRVLPGGFEYGRMNGMRPRGMIVGTGSVRDGVFEGEERIRGVLFPLPGGPTLPKLEVRLERR